MRWVVLRDQKERLGADKASQALLALNAIYRVPLGKIEFHTGECIGGRHKFLSVDPSGGGVNVLLPPITSDMVGAVCCVKNRTASTNGITVWAAPGSSIDGQGSHGSTSQYWGSIYKAVSRNLWITMHEYSGISVTPQYDYVFVCGDGGNFWKSADGGVTWTQITTGISATLQCIWGTSPTDVYVGCRDKKVYHYDGSSFTEDYEFGISGGIGTILGVTDINGSDDGSEIWAILSGYKYTTYNLVTAKKVSGSWSLYNIDLYADFLSGYIGTSSIGGIGIGDVFAIDANYLASFYAYQCDESDSLASLSSVPSTNGDCGVRQNSSYAIAATGGRLPTYEGNGTLIKFDGTTWSYLDTGLSISKIWLGNQLWISPTEDVWVTGRDYIVYYNGSIEDKALEGDWKTCHGIDDNKIWFIKWASTSDHLVKWNGTDFETATTIASFNLFGLWSIRA